MTTHNPDRRTFILGGVALTASLSMGLSLAPHVAEPDVLRPPGSQDESAFMARCIKCDRCISICPTHALRPVAIEDGLLRARTPMLDFSEASCTFCDLCRQVCPTTAIGSVDPYKPECGRIGVAILHEDRCLAFKETGSCGICIDECSYDALTFDSVRSPSLDADACNGCGECVCICPANIFTTFDGDTTRGIEVITDEAYATLRKELS